MFQVVSTETGEIFATTETLDEAVAEMHRQFPVVTPWDGIEVPVAVRKVGYTPSRKVQQFRRTIRKES